MIALRAVDAEVDRNGKRSVLSGAFLRPGVPGDRDIGRDMDRCGYWLMGLLWGAWRGGSQRHPFALSGILGYLARETGERTGGARRVGA